jgi:acyl phosphate:glycerol-3-phosphate acyltransferase
VARPYPIFTDFRTLFTNNFFQRTEANVTQPKILSTDFSQISRQIFLIDTKERLRYIPVMQFDTCMYKPAAAIGVLAVLSYLIGAIPAGFLMARARGIDIRKAGSGNIGATNVYRCVGKRWGILTFILDFLKGYLPATVFPLIVQRHSPAVPYVELSLLCGCLAVAGHNWPVYLRFKGGKGMATGAGALLGFAPLVMLSGIAAWLVCFLATRYVSVASMCAAIVIVLAAWLIARDHMLAPIALTVMGAVIIWRHKGNLRRLLAGTEYRFEFGKRKSPR